MKPVAFRSTMNQKQLASGIGDRCIWLTAGLLVTFVTDCGNSDPLGRVTAHGVVSLEGGVGPGGACAADPATLRVPVKYAKPEASGLEYTIDVSNRRLTIDIPK